jgi:hypothetical protein
MTLLDVSSLAQLSYYNKYVSVTNEYTEQLRI